MQMTCLGSNLTNKYNPQEPSLVAPNTALCSNLTNKYNPQELHNLNQYKI